MSPRKFYRTVILIEVLSEEPYALQSLADVASDIDDGDCSGKWNIEITEVVDGPTMAGLLEAQGSDPGFFRLTTDGDDSVT